MIKYSRELSDGRMIHQYWGRLSNIYILEDKRRGETCLVDCGMPSDVDKLSSVLKLFPPLKRVVCTHFHVDHMAGWVTLKDIFKECEIWFHESARPLVVGDEVVPSPSVTDWLDVLVPVMREYGYYPSPEDMFEGGWYGTPFGKGFPRERLRYFKDEASVLPGFESICTPGHRRDEVSFFDPESGVFISGDFILACYGRLTVNTYLESVEDQCESVNKVKRLEDIREVFPGHGDVAAFEAGKLDVEELDG